MANDSPARSLEVCREIATRLGYDFLFTEAPRRAASAAELAAAMLGKSNDSLLTDVEKLLLRREFVKVLAGEVRARAIEVAIRNSSATERETWFARSAELLRPQTNHPTLGDPPGAFFDPRCWDMNLMPAATEHELDLRLAAVASAMLCQEDGIQSEGETTASLSAAIIRARAG